MVNDPNAPDHALVEESPKLSLEEKIAYYKKYLVALVAAFAQIVLVVQNLIDSGLIPKQYEGIAQGIIALAAAFGVKSARNVEPDSLGGTWVVQDRPDPSPRARPDVDVVE